jgi:hypothetical protein
MLKWRGACGQAVRATAMIATLAVATLAVVTRSAEAQARGGAKPARAGKEADEKVIVLTEANWAKFIRATENLYKIETLDTATIDAADDEAGGDASPEETVASMAAKLDRIPPVKRAIANAGMTTTEYSQVQVAILFAAFQMMADSVAKMYPNAPKPPEVADPVKKANVVFLTRHTADLQRLQQLEDDRKARVEAAEEPEPGDEPAAEEPMRR